MRLTKLDVAKEQLRWALHLFLIERAPVPALALAGAAEEVFRQVAGDRAHSDRALLARLSAVSGWGEKRIRQDHLNRVRDWLKHAGRDPNAELETDLIAEAVQILARAVSNQIDADGTYPEAALQFESWVSRNRPDLFAQASSGDANAHDA